MESDEAFAIFDIRERGEYNTGQIYTASSLPRSQVEFRIADLVPIRNFPVIVYDEGGERANLAAATMEQLGYQRVYVLEGGLPAWAKVGFPIVAGVNVPSKEFGEKVHIENNVPDISPEELSNRLAGPDKVMIFDVRTPEEHQRFCIPGAYSVPGGDLILWADELRQKSDTTFLIHCAGRTRSVIGTQSLRRLGLSNVYALRNGTMGWTLADLELERNTQRQDLSPSPSSRAAGEVLASRIAQEEGIAMISVSEFLSLRGTQEWQVIYPEPHVESLQVERQKDPRVSAGMDVADSLQGQRSKATGISPWYGVYLVDVRSPAEYAEGHIPGSLGIPGGQAVQRTDDFIAVRNAKVVFVSNGHARAVMAAYWFRQMGFEDVAVLQGGVEGWIRDGQNLSTETSAVRNPILDKADAKARYLNPTELNSLSRSTGPFILNVGTSQEYQAGHIPKSVWLSRGWLELKINGSCPDNSQPIVITCPTGQQSILAALTLSERGYSDVSVLKGGVKAWIKEGHPTEKGLDGCVMEPNDVVTPASATGNKEAMVRYLEWEITLGDKFKR
jgi:rhodanese-related sulfurtransferase